MSGSIPPLSLYVLMITLYSYFTCYFRRTELRYYPRFFCVISSLARLGGSNPRKAHSVSENSPVYSPDQWVA